jgi:hypothetical protein
MFFAVDSCCSYFKFWSLSSQRNSKSLNPAHKPRHIQFTYYLTNDSYVRWYANVSNMKRKTHAQTDKHNNIIVEPKLSISDCSEDQEVIEWRERPHMYLVSEYIVIEIFWVIAGIIVSKLWLYFIFLQD